MMTIHRFVRCALLFSSLLVSAGCSNPKDPEDGGTGGGCSGQTCPFNYGSWNGDSPAVSFRTEVMGDKGTGPSGAGGIFRRSCAFGTTCHGEAVGSKATLFLAPKLLDGTTPVVITDADINEVLNNPTTGMINVPARTYPQMMRVKPGDPENSFLMRKIDGCFADLDTSQCRLQPGAVSDHACGDRMPRSSETLCEEERNIIRRWIKQGATDTP